MISTDKSLKHLKSNDKMLMANVSNYFEKDSGRDSSSYSGNWDQQKNRFPSTKRTMYFRLQAPTSALIGSRKDVKQLVYIQILLNADFFYSVIILL